MKIEFVEERTYGPVVMNVVKEIHTANREFSKEIR